MTVLKHSSIVVRVEEALTDLLVVSYRANDAAALYQGVLLHSNKRNLPYGVHSLHPALLREDEGSQPSGDRLHSVSQRFTYQEAPTGAANKPRPRQKMTVRLRARKVLCSNCQGICNENSENVVTSARRAAAAARTQRTARTEPAPNVSDDERKFLRGHSLIPKLSRLQPSEISSAINGGARAASSVAPAVAAPPSPPRPATAFGAAFSSARTLKICFGEGEGTVVKIPAIVGELNEDSGVSSDVGKSASGSETRAAKRALKRARRQARRHKKRRRVERDDEGDEGDDGDAGCEEAAPDFSSAAAAAAGAEDAGEEGGGGGPVAAGDVVWGKLAGLPWWPARVLAVGEAHASVAWYTSSATSRVHVAHLAPFLPQYNVHFDKKKRGAYREAVRLATVDASLQHPPTSPPQSLRVVS